MNRKFFSLILAVLVALVSITGPVFASTPFDVSGTMAYAGPPANLEMQSAGDNCIIDVDVTYAFSGDMVGIAPFHFRVMSHGACPAQPFQYTENLKARGTFYGSVGGKAGSLDLVFMAKGYPVEPGEPALTGKIIILSGTGDLANLQGVLDMSYIMGDGFDSYSGQFHVSP